MRRLGLVLVGLALALTAHSAGAAPRELYRTGPGTCDGLPRLPVEMTKGMCAGLVVGPKSAVFKERVLKLPRTLLPLRDGRSWIVTDLGAWVPGRGAVWRLTYERGRPPRLDPLLTGLSMPHGLALGPDGRVYVGEMSRVIAFDPGAVDPAASVRTVVSGLPDNRLHEDRHPLSEILFDPAGNLVVSVGAPSDDCGEDARAGKACEAVGGPRPAAALWRFRALAAGRFATEPEVIAIGLRNGLALAFHQSGALYEAENSYDFPDPATPYEEINRIEPGRNYGWPYCYEMDQVTPAWIGRSPLDCRAPQHARPIALISPHAAPLSMVWYRGDMFPALNGRLLMSWHGYRGAGGRLVAFDVDASGAPKTRPGAGYPRYEGGRVMLHSFVRGPAAVPAVLTPGWGATPGLRPQGAPVGVAVASDGAIWVADDRNGTIIRIAADRP
jgi:glucose/arabinose dehydrogenase